MLREWIGHKTKYTLMILLIICLLLISGFFSMLIVKMAHRDMEVSSGVATDGPTANEPSPSPSITPARGTITKPALKEEKLPPVVNESSIIEAPLVKQNPTYYSGCELASLTMLLQFYGIDKEMSELVPEMEMDDTEIQLGKDGSIQYWGDPHVGFVGDITGRNRGYSIYNEPLFVLLKKYISSAVNLTGSTFDRLEQQLSDGLPVIVWTTVDFTEPREDEWMEWDSPSGPIKATMKEHSVLLVGYDKDYVYVNDPLSETRKFKVEKEHFIESWVALGKQALSYEYH